MTYRKVSLNMDETDFTAANSYRHPRQSLNKLFRKFTRKTSPKSIVRSWSHSKKTADETLDVLLPGITNITNTSQASGVAPPDLKKYIVKPLHKINPLIKLYWKRPSNSKLITFVSNPRKVRSTQTPCTPPKRTSWILSSQPCYARLRAHQFAAWNRPPTPSPLLPERQFPFRTPSKTESCERVSHFSPWQLPMVREMDPLKTKLEFPTMNYLSTRGEVLTQFSIFSFISCHFIVTAVAAGKPSVCYLSVELTLKRPGRTVVEQV